jgi:hypothetical protein
MIAAMIPAAWLLLPALLLPGPVGQPASTQSTRTAGTSPAGHDREFWRAIIKTDHAVPANESVVPLARELSGMLASPDPELRDEFGYSILAAWIHEKKLIEPATLRELIAEWTKNLQAGVGANESDAVFRRSFSALMLSVAVARDNAAPYLDAAEVQPLLAATLTYLAREHDVRGYDSEKGWMHSAAHTADLLKFLARSRHLPAVAQHEILDAIVVKMRDAPIVFTHGEDQRFARAVLSIVNRPDFDRQAFDGFVTRAMPPRPKNSHPDAALLRANQNLTNLISKLYIVLAMQNTPGDGVRAALERVSAAAKTLF